MSNITGTAIVFAKPFLGRVEVLPPVKPMDRRAFVDFVSALIDRAVPDSYAGFPSAPSLRDYVFDIVFDGLDDAGVVPADDVDGEVPSAQD